VAPIIHQYPQSFSMSSIPHNAQKKILAGS
jgi:hypothetical protein